MVWIIVGGVVGLAIWAAVIISALDEPYSDWFDWLFMGGFLGLTWAAIAAAVVCFAANGLALPILGGNHAHHTTTWRLQAIAAHSDLHGQFFLGSGQVDSDPAYRFYRTTQDGGFVLDSADAADTTIYQDDTPPRVVEHWTSAAHPWWCFFDTGHTTYEIHVPKGSITATTNLDLP